MGQVVRLRKKGEQKQINQIIEENSKYLCFHDHQMYSSREKSGLIRNNGSEWFKLSIYDQIQLDKIDGDEPVSVRRIKSLDARLNKDQNRNLVRFYNELVDREEAELKPLYNKVLNKLNSLEEVKRFATFLAWDVRATPALKIDVLVEALDKRDMEIIGILNQEYNFDNYLAQLTNSKQIKSRRVDKLEKLSVLPNDDFYSEMENIERTQSYQNVKTSQ